MDKPESLGSRIASFGIVALIVYLVFINVRGCSEEMDDARRRSEWGIEREHPRDGYWR